MNTQHTPGPWNSAKVAAKNLGKGGASHSITCASQEEIALVNGGPDPRENIANARLIAAAPELLAELQSITDWVDANCGDPAAVTVIGYARAAIARATGEKDGYETVGGAA